MLPCQLHARIRRPAPSPTPASPSTVRRHSFASEPPCAPTARPPQTPSDTLPRVRPRRWCSSSAVCMLFYLILSYNVLYTPGGAGTHPPPPPLHDTGTPRTEGQSHKQGKQAREVNHRRTRRATRTRAAPCTRATHVPGAPSSHIASTSSTLSPPAPRDRRHVSCRSECRAPHRRPCDPNIQMTGSIEVGILILSI